MQFQLANGIGFYLEGTTCVAGRSLFTFLNATSRERFPYGVFVWITGCIPELHAGGGIMLIISVRCCRVLQSYKNYFNC